MRRLEQNTDVIKTVQSEQLFPLFRYQRAETSLPWLHRTVPSTQLARVPPPPRLVRAVVQGVRLAMEGKAQDHLSVRRGMEW